MASNSLFSSTSPLLCWGESPVQCVCVYVWVTYIMPCISGMKLVLGAGRSLELEVVDPAMGLLMTTGAEQAKKTNEEKYYVADSTT